MRKRVPAQVGKYHTRVEVYQVFSLTKYCVYTQREDAEEVEEEEVETEEVEEEEEEPASRSPVTRSPRPVSSRLALYYNRDSL